MRKIKVRFNRACADADFRELEHPRGESGKFGSTSTASKELPPHLKALAEKWEKAGGVGFSHKFKDVTPHGYGVEQSSEPVKNETKFNNPELAKLESSVKEAETMLLSGKTKSAANIKSRMESDKVKIAELIKNNTRSAQEIDR